MQFNSEIEHRQFVQILRCWLGMAVYGGIADARLIQNVNYVSLNSNVLTLYELINYNIVLRNH